MNYTLKYSDPEKPPVAVQIDNAPDLRGVRCGSAIFYTGGRNDAQGHRQPYIELTSSGIEVNTGTPGADVEIGIPDGIDAEELEKSLDCAMVQTGDMNDEQFQAKWPPPVANDAGSELV